MQKKLYFLNEEEKNRILNLHESRTKKQYLISEQNQPVDWKVEFNYVLSTPLGDGYGGRRSIVTEIINFCSGRQWTPTIDVTPIVYKIGSIMKQARYSSFDVSISDRGVTKKGVEDFGKEIEKFLTIPNFCTAVNWSEGKNIADEKNLMDIFDEISSDSAFKTYIVDKIKKLGETTQQPEQKKEEIINSDWTSYSCVPKQQSYNPIDFNLLGAKWYEAQVGTKKYRFSNIGLLYIKDGEKNIPEGEDTYYSYSCVNGKPVYNPTKVIEKKDSDSTSLELNPQQQKLPEYGGVTKSAQTEIPNLLKTIGSTDTTLTQDAINKIYNFLTKA